MLFDVSVVCNDLIRKGIDDGNRLSHLKLQKMLYFLYGHYIAECNDELFEDKFEKWPYGPVVRRVYNQFKDCGSSIITKFYRDCDGKALVPNEKSESTKCYRRVFDAVWKKYSRFSAASLSLLSHAAGSPWDIVEPNSDISPELIKKYFEGEKLQ